MPWSRRAIGSDRDPNGSAAMLYLTAVLTVLALIYLGYAMIRPERF
ncbi:MAG TPA: potassium-transporting ATPase subunit F [Isosphaeraceae bacterium]|nr:potassium-transporting ATPase subunit F [Isosphaeraceae bacterium]